MTRSPLLPHQSVRAASRRPVRTFAVALGVGLAGGVALAAWSSAAAPGAEPGMMLPRGPLLDRLLDEAGVSPLQRAQAHQIFDAADAGMRRQRGDERTDRAQMAQLIAQPAIDTAAVEAVRSRIEQRRDLESRRATQALIDVGLVLNARQRQAIASQLADGPPPSAVFRHLDAAPAAPNPETRP
jgi:Spy/CpxP family protein refolding chaperone